MVNLPIKVALFPLNFIHVEFYNERCATPIYWCTCQMLIHIILPSVDYNLLLKRLDTHFNKPTNKNPQSC